MFLLYLLLPAIVSALGINFNESVFILPDDLPDTQNGAPKALPKNLFSISPPFALVDSTNEECRNDSMAYLKNLYNFDLSAIMMYDATAKLPSGILNGNINQLGDFNQCLQAEGRYCLAYIDVKISEPDYVTLGKVHALAHSYYAFRSTPQDPGHRVPRYSSIHWAVCVPQSCSYQDVENSMNSIAKRLSAGTGLKATAKINPEMCQISKTEPLSTPTILVMYLFVALVSIVAISTITDHFVAEKEKSFSLELLLSFSLIKNGKKLFSTTIPADDISSVHGIRLLNAVMLYIAHKSMALFYSPFANRTEMAEMLGKPWTVVARAASLYTDPFIMMSGLLTSYSLGKQYQRTKKINVPKEYASRIMRLLPTLGALILFCTFVLPNMGSGPQWPLVINHHAKLCKQYWWRNMLFIHNYFGFKNMCLTHTHHIGIDTQLFLVSPLLIYIVNKWPKQGLMTLFGIGILSTALRYYTVHTRQLNLYVHFSSSISQMFNTADYSYILPTHRATVYVMGLALGYILRQWGREIKLKNSQLVLGWILAACMLYQSVLTPAKMGDRNYIYNRLDAVAYSAFAPIAWCSIFAWIIFVSYTGSGGLIGYLASLKYWQITTRLSYTFYLTQFPVFFYFVGKQRHSDTYSIQLLLDIKETMVVVAASMALTLFVEMPFQNIRNLLLARKTINKIQSSKPAEKIQ